MLGKMVTHPTTPNITPLAITIPRSVPSVNVIKQSAKKPAIDVIELPTTDLNVAAMAFAIASFLLSFFSSSS